MKIILAMVLCAMLLFGQALAEEQQEENKETVSQKEKLSYSLGYETGRSMKDSAVDIDPDIYSKAFSEGYAAKEASMTDQEMREAMVPLRKEMAAKRAEQQKEMAERLKQLAQKNKQEGEAFLAENAKKEGVVTLPSGLQYTTIKEGTGKTPQKSDKVQVHYRGTLIDGTEFDNSYKRGQPAAFAVDKVIMGWTEALQLMKEGAKWTLYIPSGLAYGERGAPRSIIGPSQTLIFEVELISVQ
jgi:FKBP-type peptidyl-prolyl cis-trans isomerase FklB